MQCDSAFKFKLLPMHFFVIWDMLHRAKVVHAANRVSLSADGNIPECYCWLQVAVEMRAPAICRAQSGSLEQALDRLER